jgi:competence protein ComEA
MKAAMQWGKTALLLAALAAAPVSLMWTAGVFAAEPAGAVQQAAVNINTASATELAESLVGVGPAKAQAIVAYREANGSFTDKSQLLEVKGIGEAILEQNAARIGL